MSCERFFHESILIIRSFLRVEPIRMTRTRYLSITLRDSEVAHKFTATNRASKICDRSAIAELYDRAPRRVGCELDPRGASGMERRIGPQNGGVDGLRALLQGRFVVRRGKDGRAVMQRHQPGTVGPLKDGGCDPR